MLRNLLVVPAITGLLACGSLAPEASRLDIRTDRAEYVRDPETGLTTIQLTITNQSNRPAYLAGCPAVPSFVAEREQAGAWQEALQVNVVCQAIYTPTQLTLLPDQSHISGATWGTVGTFRLRVLYGTTQGEEWGRSSTSAPFVVR